MSHLIVTVNDDAFPGRRGPHVHPAAHEHVVRALQAHQQPDAKPVLRDVFPVYEHPGVKIAGEKVHVIEVEPDMAINLRAPEGYYLRLHEYHGKGGDEHTFEITVQKIEDLIEEHGFDPRPNR